MACFFLLKRQQSYRDVKSKFAIFVRLHLDQDKIIMRNNPIELKERNVSHVNTCRNALKTQSTIYLKYNTSTFCNKTEQNKGFFPSQPMGPQSRLFIFYWCRTNSEFKVHPDSHTVKVPEVLPDVSVPLACPLQ